MTETAPEVFGADRRRLALGALLGQGGEGRVYALAADAQVAVKLYNRPPDAEKQAKLAAMAAAATRAISAIAAWPTATVHDAGGAFVGFTMPVVAGHLELHRLYSPAHRRKDFAQANWKFLVQAARNLAAAIDTVHGGGHVIGDLNQKGVLVHPKSALVRLIDCDSFQITRDGRRFPCLVGVPEFTAPELQDKPFAGVERRADQDDFALAVLCFHLLFLGRHPFAGRFLGPGDLPLPRAIREYRFAYARTAGALQVAPPPHTLPPSVLPERVRTMFERAFGPPPAALARERGGGSGRPAAREWVAALDEMQRGLRACTLNSAHVFPAGAGACPWCALELATGGVTFVDLAAAAVTAAAQEARFDLEAAWNLIQTVSPPGLQPPPNPHPGAIHGSPVAADVQQAWLMYRLFIFAIAAVTVVITAVTSVVAFGYHGTEAFWPPAILVGGAAAAVLFALFGKPADAGERQLRLDTQALARKALEVLMIQWRDEAGGDRFAEMLAAAVSHRDSYRELGGEYRAALEQIERDRPSVQLQEWMEGHFLNVAVLTGLDDQKRATLASFGIETAADITEAALNQVPGLGIMLRTELLEWKLRLTSHYKFDAARPADPQAVVQIEQRFANRRKLLQQALKDAPMALATERAKTLAARERLTPLIADAVVVVAQAEADVRVMW